MKDETWPSKKKALELMIIYADAFYTNVTDENLSNRDRNDGDGRLKLSLVETFFNDLRGKGDVNKTQMRYFKYHITTNRGETQNANVWYDLEGILMGEQSASEVAIAGGWWQTQI